VTRPWPWTIIAAVSAVLVVLVAFALWRASRRRRAILGAVTAAIGARDPRAELPTPAGAMAGAASVDAAAIAAGPIAAEPVTPLEIKTKFPEKEVLKERVLAAAREHPEEIAQILRAWISKRRVTT